MNLRMIANSAVPLVLALALTFPAASAEAAVADYVGFAWETGGIAPSAAGDELSLATVVTQIDPLFEVDLDLVEGTLFIDGLISLGGSTDPATGTTTINYSGGTLRLYADPSANHDWGTNPANGTVPASFVDGDLVFEGAFTAFVVSISASGAGAFEGFLDGVGGSALAGPCTGCAYTFAGAFTADTGANIPLGYDLQVDGKLNVESAVATEAMSWGAVKQLFR